MTTIHKQILSIRDEQKIQVPPDAEILSVHFQRGQLCVWYECTPQKMDYTCVKLVDILIFGTGHPIPDVRKKYLGTVQMAGGDLIWHVFEKL